MTRIGKESGCIILQNIRTRQSRYPVDFLGLSGWTNRWDIFETDKNRCRPLLHFAEAIACDGDQTFEGFEVVLVSKSAKLIQVTDCFSLYSLT